MGPETGPCFLWPQRVLLSSLRRRPSPGPEPPQGDADADRSGAGGAEEKEEESERERPKVKGKDPQFASGFEGLITPHNSQLVFWKQHVAVASGPCAWFVWLAPPDQLRDRNETLRSDPPPGGLSEPQPQRQEGE